MKQGHNYDRKLERVLRESAKVIAHKGYEGASIREISAASGVSPAGLYYYFSSKEELLFLIQRRCLEQLLDSLSERLRGIEMPADCLSTIVRNHVDLYGKHPDEMRVLSHERDRLSAPRAEVIARLRQDYADITETCVRRLVPSAPEGVHRIATLALLGMLDGVWSSYPPARELRAEDLGPVILALFLDGVRSSQTLVQPRTWKGSKSLSGRML